MASKKNALLVYSGGMDSTVLLYERQDEIALAVTFDYGSKHNAGERHFAKDNCRRLGIEHVVISLAFMKKHFNSNLFKGGGDIPEGHYADESMKSTVVPFRNGIMLSVAAGLAESRGLDVIMLANHYGDHAIYPDCRATFIVPMNEAIEAGTYQGVRLVAPYTLCTKRDIAERGRVLNVPFDNTYSCYKGMFLKVFGVVLYAVHCGKCGTCVERKEALDGFDNTDYAIDLDGEILLPPHP